MFMSFAHHHHHHLFWNFSSLLLGLDVFPPHNFIQCPLGIVGWTHHVMNYFTSTNSEVHSLTHWLVLESESPSPGQLSWTAMIYWGTSSSPSFILKTSISSTLSLGRTFFLIWGFSTYPWTPPIQSVNLAHPYHPSHILSKSSCPYLHISPLPPPHSYRLTPNHLHSYAPHAQTTSIYHALPPQPCSQSPKDCTNPHCASYPSATIFVSSHMYPENLEGTQVIIGSMNMGYISDSAKNRTHNLFRSKREPIPLGHRDGNVLFNKDVIITTMFCFWRNTIRKTL